MTPLLTYILVGSIVASLNLIVQGCVLFYFRSKI